MSDVQEFPKMLYFKGDATNQRTVNSADEEDALGADWVDAPTPDFEAQKGPAPGSQTGAATSSGYDPAGTEKDKDDNPKPITSAPATGDAPPTSGGKKR